MFMIDKGKILVWTNQQQYDAQQICKELQDYALHSTKVTMDAMTLLQYITTTSLGDSIWEEGCHAFILQWKDQVRKYHGLNTTQTILVTLQQTLMQNVVHHILELCAIKVQAKKLKAHTGKNLNFNQ